MYVCVFPYAQPEDEPFEGRHIVRVGKCNSVKLSFLSDDFMKVATQLGLSIVLKWFWILVSLLPSKRQAVRCCILGWRRSHWPLSKYAESTDNIKAFSLDWKYLKEVFLPCLPWQFWFMELSTYFILPVEFLFSSCPFSKEYSKVHNTEWVSSEHFRQSYSANPAAPHLYENPVFTTLFFPWGQGILNRLFSQWVPLWM